MLVIMLHNEFELVNLNPYVSFLNQKSFCIFGASGLIGRYLIGLLLCANQKYSLNLKITAVAHQKSSVEKLLTEYGRNKEITVQSMDLCKPLEGVCDFDFIVQGASPADPISYATNPVGTFLTNVDGCKHVLQWMSGSNAKMVYLSSGEVYGQRQTDDFGYLEDEYGDIDHLLPRACYSMGKRASETLCRLFVEQYGHNVVIARLCHVYGPTISDFNTRADAQFLRKARMKQDIVLKSRGEQVRSYCYVADVCTALMALLKNGESGQAYNVSNANSVVSIFEFAKQMAEEAGVKVKFENPDEIEAKGFTKITRAVLNSQKLQNLGWQAEVDLKSGLSRTL